MQDFHACVINGQIMWQLHVYKNLPNHLQHGSNLSALQPRLGDSVSPYPWRHSVWSQHFILAGLVGVQRRVRVVLVCTSVTAKYSGHLFCMNYHLHALHTGSFSAGEVSSQEYI